MQIKVEKMKAMKPKPRKAKRDDWKRDRKAARQAKKFMQGQSLSA
tara:strand:- start:128 stop:262 length:135 start_codon:yes stop_codon:yes gene_type:complete